MADSQKLCAWVSGEETLASRDLSQGDISRPVLWRKSHDVRVTEEKRRTKRIYVVHLVFIISNIGVMWSKNFLACRIRLADHERGGFGSLVLQVRLMGGS